MVKAKVLVLFLMLPCFSLKKILAFISLAILAKHTNATRICEASGYCSLTLQPSKYIGSIQTNKQLKLALTTLAFKNEVIITMETRPDAATQIIANLQHAGYGHTLLIARNIRLCLRIAQIFPQYGCGWYDHPLDQRLAAVGKDLNMYFKFLAGVRAVRMGYNVMLLDSGDEGTRSSINASGSVILHVFQGITL